MDGTMTYEDLEKAIAKILPHASFEVDNDDQIVIYTGLKELRDEDQLVSADFDEDSDELDTELEEQAQDEDQED
jgi:hypothetical protein